MKREKTAIRAAVELVCLAMVCAYVGGIASAGALWGMKYGYESAVKQHATAQLGRLLSGKPERVTADEITSLHWFGPVSTAAGVLLVSGLVLSVVYVALLAVQSSAERKCDESESDPKPAGYAGA